MRPGIADKSQRRVLLLLQPQRQHILQQRRRRRDLHVAERRQVVLGLRQLGQQQRLEQVGTRSSLHGGVIGGPGADEKDRSDS